MSLAALLFFSLTAAATQPTCDTAVNKELSTLGMGTVSQQAAGVTKTPYGDTGGFEFKRPAGGDASQVVSVAPMFGGSKWRIYIDSPSVVFGGHESKEVVLNAKCEVEGFELDHAGVGAHLFAEQCATVDKCKSGSYVVGHYSEGFNDCLRSAFAGGYWPQNQELVGAVEKNCDAYKSQFVKSTGAAPGAGHAPDGAPPGASGQ